MVGNYTISNGAAITPSPTVGVSPLGNPLASLPTPSVGSCTYTNYNVPYGNATLSNGTLAAASPSAAAPAVKFNGGTYILKGGGIATLAAAPASPARA